MSSKRLCDQSPGSKRGIFAGNHRKVLLLRRNRNWRKEETPLENNRREPLSVVNKEGIIADLREKFRSSRNKARIKADLSDKLGSH